MSDAPRLPKRVFRLVWDSKLGYPRPHGDRRWTRTYDDAIGAARQIKAFECWPHPVEIVGLHVGEVVWKPVDLDQLPEVAA